MNTTNERAHPELKHLARVVCRSAGHCRDRLGCCLAGIAHEARRRIADKCDVPRMDLSVLIHDTDQPAVPQDGSIS